MLVQALLSYQTCTTCIDHIKAQATTSAHIITTAAILVQAMLRYMLVQAAAILVQACYKSHVAQL